MHALLMHEDLAGVRARAVIGAAGTRRSRRPEPFAVVVERSSRPGVPNAAASNSGPLATLTTTSTGNGTLDYELRTLMILAGTTNDVMYRLVDNDAAPTTELRSDCMTITAR